MPQKKLRLQSTIVTITLIALALVMSMAIAPAPIADAQIQEPTNTPTDPIWNGFSLARDAIEEQEEINLDFVRRWDFFQDDWSIPNAAHPENAAGIDSCLSTVGIAQARESYFGITYVITALNGNVYEARVSFDLEDVVVCDIMSVAATPSVADPESTAEAGDLPPALAGAGAGGAFELGGHVVTLDGFAIDSMNTAGMRWVKYQLPVSAGVQQGISRIENVQANGFKILLGVVGDKNQIAADFDGYAATYAAFVAELAAAGADAIEIWNEPNIDREWPTGQVSGANYTQLLAVASNAIRGANPNTIIISGAPAPTGFFGAAGCGETGCNDDVFMQQMASAGAGQYIDCVGLHYNEGVLPPSAFSGDPRGEFPTYYFSSMTNRGTSAFPGLPVCYTELGYLSGEGMGAPIPSNFNWSPNDPVTVAEQAAWLAEAAALAAQRGDVRIMIVWNVNYTRWDTDPMGGYAIIRPDGSCPACSTLGTVMNGG
ncbi:MAG: hypothetical protein AAFR81_09400 [Chloroflexota bacterium]